MRRATTTDNRRNEKRIALYQKMHGAIRLFIDHPGQRRVEVSVQDLSPNGVSFICPCLIKPLKPGEIIHLALYHRWKPWPVTMTGEVRTLLDTVMRYGVLVTDISNKPFFLQLIEQVTPTSRHWEEKMKVA